jgi:hypothetical protein
MSEHLDRYLQIAMQDARIVELRHNRGARWESGLYDNLENLKEAILSRIAEGNIYTSLNRPTGICANNKFGASALRDEDIEVITRIVFDFDPRRPAGMPSTNSELGAAIAARDILVDTLGAYGWPMPGLGVSGNGAHAVYRSCLHSTVVWKQKCATLYAGLRGLLRDRFTELSVDFDTSVRNPARVWRCYGTVNRKGEVTTHRPHRRASIFLPNGPWESVKSSIVERTVQLLTPVVAATPAPVRSSLVPIGGLGDYATLDVVAWFTNHGVYRAPLTAGKHAVHCPWSCEHTTVNPLNGSDTVIWEATENWPTFHCSHLHCHGRTILDVMDLWGDADSYCAQTWRRDHR